MALAQLEEQATEEINAKDIRSDDGDEGYVQSAKYNLKAVQAELVSPHSAFADPVASATELGPH